MKRGRIFTAWMAGICTLVLALSLSSCSAPAATPTTAPAKATTAPAAPAAPATSAPAAKAEAKDAAAKPAAEQQALKLKFGSTGQVKDPKTVYMDKFSKLFTQRANGKVELTYIAGEQLGGEKDIMEGAQLGTVAMYHGGYTGTPIFDAMNIPYIFKNTDHLNRVINGPIGEEWSQAMIKEKGLRVIGHLARGPRHMTTNRAINTVSDMKGLKIRVPEIAPILQGFKALGSAPTPMAITEVFTALQQGTIDGQENPLETIAARSFSDVQKYLILSEHVYSTHVVLMDERVWQKMTPETQKLFMSTFNEVNKELTDEVAKGEDGYLNGLKSKGMTVIKPDLAAFREATMSVGKEFGPKAWGDDIYQRVLKEGEK